MLPLMRKVCMGAGIAAAVSAAPFPPSAGSTQQDVEAVKRPGMSIEVTGRIVATEKRKSQQSDGKTLFLTFDDGPIEGSENLLKVLADEKVEATLFYVARHAQKRPGILRRAASMPWLQIANHTYSHANGKYSRFYSSLWGVLSDVEHAQLILGGPKYLRLAGRNVWRLPEVHRNDGALSLQRRSVEIPKYEQLSKEGFFIYGWDVEWHFDHASGRPIEGAQRLAERIESIARHQRLVRKNKVVLLAHDFMFKDRCSAKMLRSFIRIMRERGWRFRTIAHYSSYRPKPLKVAKYYGHKPVRELALAQTVKRSTAHKAVSAKPVVSHPSTVSPLQSGRSPLVSDATPLTAKQKVAVTRRSRIETRPGPLEALSPKGFYSHSDSATGHAGSGNLQKSVSRNGKAGRQSSVSIQARLNNAIRHYDARQVEKLIGQGARVNRRDEFGRTPLNTAIKANSIVLVKKLLSLGADLRTTDAAGVNAIAAAKSYRRKAIENYLLAYASRGRRSIATIAQNDQPTATVVPDTSHQTVVSRRRDPLKYLRQ